MEKQATFTVSAIRCEKCDIEAATPTTEHAKVFMLKHQDHKRIKFIGRAKLDGLESAPLEFWFEANAK